MRGARTKHRRLRRVFQRYGESRLEIERRNPVAEEQWDHSLELTASAEVIDGLTGHKLYNSR